MKIRMFFQNRAGIVARMVKRFYVNFPLAPGRVTVEGPEAHHLAGVSRLRSGDPVCLFNGDGHEYRATIVTCARKRVNVEVIRVESPQRELPFPVEIAAPLPKGDRGQFLLEKLTELGIASFVPLRTERSVVHPGESRLEKLERYVIEASKQCGRNVLMRIGHVIDWSEYCRQKELPKNRIFAHPGLTSDPDFGLSFSPQDCALTVGPEGGFTEEEVKTAQGEGWRLISLGPRILRLETAAMALAAWVSLGTISEWGT